MGLLWSPMLGLGLSSSHPSLYCSLDSLDLCVSPAKQLVGLSLLLLTEQLRRPVNERSFMKLGTAKTTAAAGAKVTLTAIDSLVLLCAVGDLRNLIS